MIVDDLKAERALKFLEQSEEEHAQAKSDLREIEKSEKALIAQLKLKSSKKHATEREDEAYASPEYDTWKKGLRAAVENLTVLENKRDRAQTVIELFRTESANHRRL